MSAQVSTETEVVERPIHELQSHPENGIFPDLLPSDFQALVADIRANGLQHPVEILPDGTILAGHQRLRALKQLKKKAVLCKVRHDLEELDRENQ